MKILFNILVKLLVVKFYQRNAGLFLFLFVVLFGAAQNPKLYHYQLMLGIVQSPVTLVIVLLLWLLYNFKCMGFINKNMVAAENRFLIEMQGQPILQTYMLFLLVQLLVFAPVFIYAIITAFVGLDTGHLAAAISLVLFILLLPLATAYFYIKLLFGEIGPIKLGFNTGIVFPKQFFALLIWQCFYEGKVKLIVVKFLSFSLFFIPFVWNADHFVMSDFILFLQAAIAAHAVIVYDAVQYVETRFPLIRNMPVRLYSVFLLFPTAYIVMLLPEGIMFWYYGHKVDMPISPLLLLVYFIGQMVFFTAIAYEKQTKMESFLTAVGFITVGSLFVAPLLSLGVLGIMLLIIGAILFTVLYPKYETDFGSELEKSN